MRFFMSQGNRFYKPDDLGGGGSATNSTNQANTQEATTGQATAQPVNPVTVQNQSQGENFTNIDPTKLPPELQPLYKNMLGDYTKKTMEASPWRKLGEELGMTPEQVRDGLSQLQYINQNPQAVIEDYVLRNPPVFNALAQKLGPQAAFQAIGQGLFNQTPQDRYQKYRDVYEQTGDVGKLVESIFTDVTAHVNQAMDQRFQQELKPLQADNQATKQYQLKTMLETQLDLQKERLTKLGITKEKVMQTIDANKLPYNVALSTPFLFNAMITEAAGGLDTLLNNAGTQSVQTYQQEVINNHQQTAPVGVGGGASAVVAQPILQERNQIKNAMQERLNQFIAQQKT